MKKTSFRLLLAIGSVLLTLMLAGCPTEQTFTLSGSFMKSGIANGTYAYTKLVAQGGLETDAALYWTRSAAFSGDEATYSIDDIQQGTYTQHSFIDTDNDAAGDATSLPDTGD
jgi:outer membrane protein assembly factor BamE (lipoprotein component of BamABCDE complex)